jgi:hypothetical protein
MQKRKELDAADLKDRIRKNHLSRRGEIEDEDEFELFLVLGSFSPGVITFYRETRLPRGAIRRTKLLQTPLRWDTQSVRLI